MCFSDKACISIKMSAPCATGGTFPTVNCTTNDTDTGVSYP